MSSRAASNPTRSALPVASPARKRGRPFRVAARAPHAMAEGADAERTRGESAMPAFTHSTRVPGETSARAGGPLAAPAGSGLPSSSLVAWYLGLIPHWMGAEPGLRRTLLLRTHQWIIDRVLDPDVGILGAAADLRHDGALTRTLRALVPADDARDWAHFIAVLVANLRHALLLPVARRNEAWVRWLFLIPYSVQWEALGAPRSPGGRRA